MNINVRGCDRTMIWTESPNMANSVVKRWLESDEGDIISVVTGNSKGNMRMGIDGEIRCSIGPGCFSIPCTLNVVAKKTNPQLIRIVERVAKRRKFIRVE